MNGYRRPEALPEPMAEPLKVNRREACALPKISVIVPIYKTEAHLERCLRSIMGQTLSEIEII